jgi:hypothetical protein
MEEPEVKPAEPRKTKKQKDPRAVGILRFDSKGKATLIPVAILVDGRFYDATSYKADPVPMALESGTVYEAEQGGESQGLFTVNGALHSKGPRSVNPWVGTGSFLPRGSEAPKTTQKAEDVPRGIDNSGDEPPRLTKGKDKDKDSKAEPAPSTSAPSSDAGNSTSATSSSGSSGTASGAPDRSGGTTPAAAQPKDSTAGASAKQDSATTASGKEKEKNAESTETAEPSSEQPQNYYRPALRRGKPTESAPPESETSDRGTEPVAGATASHEDSAKLVPAISDAGGPEPRPYKFFWKEGEEDERRKQMLVLAGEELRIYVNARAKGMISANPPPAKAGAPARKTAAKPAPPVFENVQFHAFDVWVNNQPVMILTADGHYPRPPGASAEPEVYHITLAARTDIYGSLRKMYSGVTDKFHLDVTPQLELIDAVDADGDGRAELLFRETTDAGTGYIIYRPTADKLWKMFDSLE